MKSSIKIDFLDRGTGKGIEPVIRIELISSEDPRDTLIQTLFESVQGSSYLQLVYSYPEQSSEKNHSRILLFKPEIDMAAVMDIMWGKFREWLKEKDYKALEIMPEDAGVYYKYGNGRVSQDKLFSLFVNEQYLKLIGVSNQNINY